MAADSKTSFIGSVKKRLDVLGCPLTEGTDESWIKELVFRTGEPRLKLLQWLLSKFDTRVGAMLDASSSFQDTTVDSRIRKLLLIVSSLGLCRYDDVDLIRGADATASRQVTFFDHLLDIVMICDAAEDPMTKSMLNPCLVSESTSLDDQLASDCRYIDTLVAQQVHTGMFLPTVEILPPDISRRIQANPEIASATPDLQALVQSCNSVEGNLLRQLDVLDDVRKMTADEQIVSDSKTLQIAARSLDLVLRELTQLVLSFTYCYETEMQPWCQKEPPCLSELGPAFKRVHSLMVTFSQVLKDVQLIHQSFISLNQDIKRKINTDESTFLVKASQAAAHSFQECVDILQESIQQQNTSLSCSLCSSVLKT